MKVSGLANKTRINTDILSHIVRIEAGGFGKVSIMSVWAVFVGFVLISRTRFFDYCRPPSLQLIRSIMK
jgi:hypothetical protein